MISIIVCSRDKKLLEALCRNITDSVGCNYEMITIDNSIRRDSIFKIYNEGLDRACGELIVFVHEDVQFVTKDWGKKIDKHFIDNENLGLLGVAGSQYISVLPTAHWFQFMNVNQVIQTDGEGDHLPEHFCSSALNEIPVCIIDGVFMCLRADLKNSVRFDEETFNGFHMYDSDISMQVLQAGYEVACASDILLRHMSYGNADDVWYSTLVTWTQKWRKYLPQLSCAVQKNDLETADYQILLRNVSHCRTEMQKFHWLCVYIFKCNATFNKVLHILSRYLGGRMHN